MVADPDRHALIAAIWRAPLARMLLLSASLHAALVMIVQPRPFAPVSEEIVINARLLEKAADSPQQQAVRPPDSAPPRPPSPAANRVESAAEEQPPEYRSPAHAAVPPQPVQADERTAGPPAASGPAPASALPSLPVMIDTNWYEARQLDVQPMATARIEPVYPPDAQQNGIEGTVKLKLKIDEFGSVREVEVAAGDPPGVFDASALAAFRQVRFTPARRNGSPVRALVYIRVRYGLND
ncbi:MAG: energy transducer TonB [Thiobacillus sp.]|nr:energy transducer TonB [Thiobacillus sp.]